MDILNTKALECNRQIKINFDRGDLSSDAGLLLMICSSYPYRKEFYETWDNISSLQVKLE